MGLYMVSVTKNGEHCYYLSSGRPCTIRVYSSLESAQRGIRQSKKLHDRYGYELEVVEITQTQGVE
jgi:hypothetical protein